MADICANCTHFDEENTSLPVCVLHKRFMHKDWTCGDFERSGDGKADKAKV